MGDIFGLPAFLWMVFVLYWSLPLSGLAGYIKVWKVWGKRNDVVEW